MKKNIFLIVSLFVIALLALWYTTLLIEIKDLKSSFLEQKSISDAVLKKVDDQESTIYELNEIIMDLKSEIIEKDKILVDLEKLVQEKEMLITEATDKETETNSKLTDFVRRLLYADTNSQVKSSGEINNIKDAINYLQKYIDDNNIIIEWPGYQVQFWEVSLIDNELYYIMRISYIDPNNRDYTMTVARYWINAFSLEVLREDLDTNTLYSEID